MDVAATTLATVFGIAFTVMSVAFVWLFRKYRSLLLLQTTPPIAIKVAVPVRNLVTPPPSSGAEVAPVQSAPEASTNETAIDEGGAVRQRIVLPMRRSPPTPILPTPTETPKESEEWETTDSLVPSAPPSSMTF
jgi:hypothetical protein